MSEAEVQLDQLDSWARDLKDGRALVEEANALGNQAQVAEAARRWREAAEKFRQARATYTRALDKLAAPAGIGETSFKALNTLRDDAQRLLRQAQASLQALDGRAENCDLNITKAATLLQQAHAELSEGNYVSAHSLASQAGEGDPTLREEAEELIRAVEEEQHEPRSPLSLVGLVAFAIILIAVGVFIIPRLWTWINEILLPVGTVIIPLLR